MSQGALMIVCVCNNISDRKIRKAVDAGMTSLADLRKNLDLGTCCGKCHSCAKQVLRECIEERAESSMFPFTVLAA
jgi:bacterioferritin-associated ferredoxin